MWGTERILAGVIIAEGVVWMSWMMKEDEDLRGLVFVMIAVIAVAAFFGCALSILVQGHL